MTGFVAMQGERRRSGDTVTDMLNDRLDGLSSELQRHITDCSTQSRRLFWAVVSLLGWLIVKSLPFAAKMFPIGGS